MQEGETVLSAGETSAPGQVCAAMTIFQMCLFSSSLSWSFQEEILGCQGSAAHRLGTPLIEVSRAQRVRQHADIVKLCMVHLFSFPDCFACSQFSSLVYAVPLPFIYYIDSKSCNNRNLFLFSF